MRFGDSRERERGNKVKQWESVVLWFYRGWEGNLVMNEINLCVLTFYVQITDRKTNEWGA